MSGSDPDGTNGGIHGEPAGPGPGGWRRLVRNPDRDPLTDRLRDAMLRPAVASEIGPADKAGAPEPTTVEEIEGAIARCSDQERLIGLMVAPLAAAIGLVVTGSLIANDPKARLANGLLNVKHTNPSLYLGLGGMAFVFALVMLAMAWYRKRLYLGIASALYGLSVFNLHFWELGVPFILIGSWYLVRAYRLQQKLKLAQSGGGGRLGGRPGPGRPNKRYTPPSAR